MTVVAWFFFACEVGAACFAFLIAREAWRIRDELGDTLVHLKEAQEWNRLLLQSVLRDVDPPDELAARRKQK